MASCRCSPTADTCPTSNTPTASPPCSAPGSPHPATTRVAPLSPARLRPHPRRTGYDDIPSPHRMTTGETPPAASPGSEVYRSQAGHYDRRTDAFRQWRELLVASLPLRPGDTVLDVGCGTGLCAPLLYRKVGPTGTIIGIDESEQILAVAAHSVTGYGRD